jgi:hypothetical protein
VAWFRKKPNELERLAGLADEVRDTAIRRFAERGLAVTVQEGTSGLDTVLVTADRRSFPLYNLTTNALAGRLDDVQRIVRSHVDGLVDAGETPDSTELSDAEWLDLVRVRLVPLEAAQVLKAQYPQRIAEDFAVMVCLDYPTHISYLYDSSLGDHDPVALAAVGLASVMDEPIESAEELRPGIWLIEDDSPYTATKVLGMERLIGTALPEAPNGALFGVPHRHAILVHPVVGEETVAAASVMMSLIGRLATDSAPGGALSTSMYFWHDGVIDLVGVVGLDGRRAQIIGSGRFGQILQELMG